MLVMLVMMVVLVPDMLALLERHILHQHFRLWREESTLVSKTKNMKSGDLYRVKTQFLGEKVWTRASFISVDS